VMWSSPIDCQLLTQFRISSCHQLSQGSSREMSQLGDEARFKGVLGGWVQSVDDPVTPVTPLLRRP
jgi:hypothetical protein